MATLIEKKESKRERERERVTDGKKGNREWYSEFQGFRL